MKEPATGVSEQAAWDLIVELVVPDVWSVAVREGFTMNDAADVCDATLLALLDRLRSTSQLRLRSTLLETVRDMARVECRRRRALDERRVIDLRGSTADSAWTRRHDQ